MTRPQTQHTYTDTQVAGLILLFIGHLFHRLIIAHLHRFEH